MDFRQTNPSFPLQHVQLGLFKMTTVTHEESKVKQQNLCCYMFYFEASVIRLVQRSLNTFTIFNVFITPWPYSTYEVAIFAEWVDNGSSGCSWVVNINSIKWGHFRGDKCTAQCAPIWLVGLVRKPPRYKFHMNS